MRPVHAVVSLLAAAVLLAVAPASAADPAGDLQAAERLAGQGGLAAQASLRAMLWTEPMEAAAYCLARPTAAERNYLDEAAKVVRAILAAKPDLASALVLLGRLSWIDGRAVEAAELYQRALASAPDYGPALLGLADIYLDRREQGKAQAVLARIAAGDRDAEVGLRLAVLALWQGDGPGAISAIAATEPPADGNDLAHLWTLAKAYALSGDPGAAAALLRRETPAWAHGLWAEQAALAALGLGDEERSLAGLGEAAASLPACPLPRLEKGALLLARREIGGALEALAGERYASDGLAAGRLFLLGQAKEAANDLPGAAKAYADLIARRPRLGLAYYCLGRVYYRMQRYSDALRYLGTGIAVSPGLPWLYLQRAEIYEKIKMRAQAAKDRQNAAAAWEGAEPGGMRLCLRTVNGPNLRPIALVGLEGGQAPPRGIFLSADGHTWRWHPWRASSIAVPGVTVGQTIFAQPDGIDGNGAVLSGRVPPPQAFDSRPPLFVQPCMVTKDNDGLFVHWRADEPVAAEVRIWLRGGDEAKSSRMTVSAYSPWHRVAIGELFPGEYCLRVIATDAAGNAAASEIVYFRPDRAAQSLTGRIELAEGRSHVNVRQIRIGLSVDGGDRGVSVRLANENSLFTDWLPLTPFIIWELSPGDGAKRISVQFRRGSELSPVYTREIILDTRLPAIFDLLVPAVGDADARLTWKTDEAAECRVDIKLGETWFAVYVGAGMAESHAATLTGLQRGAKYRLRIEAVDRAGNVQTIFADLSLPGAPGGA